MPHFIAECTENIRDRADLPGLFAAVNPYLADSGLFPLGGIRSRAHWLETWQMADGQHDFAFVHMTLKIGHGRAPDVLKPVMAGLFDLITRHFAALSAERYLALSLAVEELHPVLNFRQNNAHALFR